MTRRCGCWACGYAIADHLDRGGVNRCPECGSWNEAGYVFATARWPRWSTLAPRMLWPGPIGLLVVVTAVLAGHDVLYGVVALASLGVSFAAPAFAALRLAEVRVCDEDLGRAVGLMTAAAVVPNLALIGAGIWFALRV